MILSASVGRGHDGVSFELSRRLRQYGHRVEVRNYLDALPFGIGLLLPWVYERQLRMIPGSYDRLYRAVARSRVLQWLGRCFASSANPRLRRWMRGVDLVIATYPLAAQAAGRLRRRRQAPRTIVFLTDFSAHPLWVAPDADLHLALHEVTAAQVRAVDPTAAVRIGGPVVREEFRPGLVGATVCELRRRYGIPEGRRVALLVAGSWGVGQVDRAARELAETGAAVPVVVCGHNEALRARLARRGLGVPLGWVEDMADLMRACDVLIQNAGGLTSVEAFAVSLPVVSYRCLAGHGRTNAEAMAEAGVAVHACGQGSLADVLYRLDPLSCARLTRRASRLFATDPAELVEGWLSEPEFAAHPRQRYARPRAALAVAVAAVLLAVAVVLPARDEARIDRLVHSMFRDIEGRARNITPPVRPVHRPRSAGLSAGGQAVSRRWS